MILNLGNALTIGSSILRTAGVIEILLYLEKYPGGRRKVDIRMDLHLNPKTAIKAFNMLMNEHLLKTMRYSNLFAYTLTEIGQKIAKYLRNIQEEIEKLKKDKNYKEKAQLFEYFDTEYVIDKNSLEDADSEM